MDGQMYGQTDGLNIHRTAWSQLKIGKIHNKHANMDFKSEKRAGRLAI